MVLKETLERKEREAQRNRVNQENNE